MTASENDSLPKRMDLAEALAVFASEETPSPACLRAFSDLSGEQLARWQEVWRTLPPGRRAALMKQMCELAEEDIEADFRALFRIGLEDPDARVRLSAVEGLFEEEHPELISPLIRLMQNDPDELVRAAAAELLGQFMCAGELGRLSRERRDQVYAALMRTLLTSPQSSIVHRRALESLAYVTNEEVDLQIRQAYYSEDELLRLSAVMAMGRSSNRAYCALVRKELLSVSPLVRRYAAEAAGQLEDQEAVPLLAELLDDPSDEVRFAAMDALALIGGEDAKAHLMAAAESEDEVISEYAHKALEEFDFWHGEMDFPLIDLDEEDLTPKPVDPRSNPE
jgi:HEAT repeat protein